MSLEQNVIHTGDCFDVLVDLPAESVHAVVTDPPYGLAFMGRDWDDFEPKEYQEWCEEWATEVKRVLKPGGHMLAFSGNRTHHRLFTGVEDAGFEIRDTLTWHYGSGFPKASDISKTIDKRADAEREVVGENPNRRTGRENSNTHNRGAETRGRGRLPVDRRPSNTHNRGAETVASEYITEPATDAAKKWDGWKTGLKPATEFVVMARKPFDGATVDCVLEHGTGALNIEACRIPTDEDTERTFDLENTDTAEGWDRPWMQEGERTTGGNDKGRYPSNLIFDEVAAEQLDAEVGELEGPWGSNSDSANEDSSMFNVSGGVNNERWASESGGPSRYFYTSKATKAERTLDGKIDNAHPTVKPGDLMQWLVKLVTAENQIVLDPFCGSGTTCRAAKDLNRRFIGIERQSRWADVARVRAGLTPNDPSTVRDDAGQSGFEYKWGTNDV